MFTISVSKDIQRPATQVFEFAGDYANDPAWRAGVIQMTYEGSNSAAVGVRTRETMRTFGRTAVTVAEITEYSSTRTAFRSLSGPVACEGSREFITNPLGTKFSYSLTLYPSGAVRVLEPLLRIVFQRQAKADLQRLKAHLERHQERQ